MVGSTQVEGSAQVLVVEDESEIRELISLLLLKLGLRVQQCANATQAYDCYQKDRFDLVILDWMMPQISGIDFLKSITHQKEPKPPVLMVTAKAEPENIVQGLESGADDYITKPFEPSVFAARVRALLRRSREGREKGDLTSLTMGPVKMNLSTHQVTCCNRELHLTPSEFKILFEMGHGRGKVLTRDYLVSVVQGEGITVTGRTVDTHVFGLRKKLGECADVIETIRGVGYRVKIEP